MSSSNKSRNFRRRGGGEDGEDENIDEKGTKTQPKSTPAKPLKSTTPLSRSRLSFSDAEEDAESTPVRSQSRPSSSKPNPYSFSSSKTRKSGSASAPRPPLPSNVQPQAGSYTPESLLELQKNTKTFASSRVARVEPLKTTGAPSEPVIVFKGLVKPSSSDSIDHSDGMIGLEKRNQSAGSVAEEEDSTSAIMDQARINAIKAQRERMRQAGPAAPDFISLDSGSNHGEAEGLSDEEPEFRGRIGFLGVNKDSAKKGVFASYEETGVEKISVIDNETGSEDEEDDAEEKWEEEQARKGLGVVRGSVTTSSVGAGAGTGTGTGTSSSSTSVSVVKNVSMDTSGFSFGGDAISISQQAEDNTKALFENLKMMEDGISKIKALYARNDANMTASLSNITSLENAFTAAGEKFIFMQKLREFLSVLCDFLQDKAPYIEELEDQIKELHEKRAASIIERRTADDSDEMRELEAAVAAAMSVLSKGGNSAVMVEAASKAAQAAYVAARDLKDLPVELDELGRDLNMQKRKDSTRRAQNRERRRGKSDSKRFSSMNIDGSNQKIEGESSTDESDSETAAYQSSRDELLRISKQIFSDAANDYAQLSAVVEKLGRWKKEYASTYKDAYMSLSAPAIFSPYVRLELLEWDPLHQDSDFNDMEWHSLLFDYGASDDDDDTNLIPELVEKVAIPILHHQLTSCWDMLSTLETKNAVSATTLVFTYVPASSEALGNLVTALRDRLADAVTSLKIPTWDTLVLRAVPNAARAAAHKFGVSVRLLRNICSWNKILAMPILEKLALELLLNGKVLPHLRSIQSNIHDAIMRSERVVASLNGVWAGRGVAGDRSKLRPLVDYLLVLARILEKRHMSGGDQAETASIARRLKKMLVELNEYDHARAISRTFNLKEAL